MLNVQLMEGFQLKAKKKNDCSPTEKSCCSSKQSVDIFLLRHRPPSAPISLVQFRGHPTQRGSNSKCQRVGLKTSDCRQQFKRTASTSLKTQHCTCAIAQKELPCTANEKGTRQALDTFHQHSCFQYSHVLVVFPVPRLTVFRRLLLSRSHGTSGNVVSMLQDIPSGVPDSITELCRSPSGSRSSNVRNPADLCHQPAWPTTLCDGRPIEARVSFQDTTIPTEPPLAVHNKEETTEHSELSDYPVPKRATCRILRVHIPTASMKVANVSLCERSATVECPNVFSRSLPLPRPRQRIPSSPSLNFQKRSHVSPERNLLPSNSVPRA